MDHSKDSIKALLAKSDAAVERALVVLAARQTSDELAGLTTRHTNNRGFSKFDAEIFTSFANRIKRGQRLTMSQLAVCRRADKRGHSRIGKYAGQLLDEANAKRTEVRMTEVLAVEEVHVERETLYARDPQMGIF